MNTWTFEDITAKIREYGYRMKEEGEQRIQYLNDERDELPEPWSIEIYGDLCTMLLEYKNQIEVTF